MSSVLAWSTVHCDAPSSVVALAQGAGRRHPVQRLVGAAVGVHQHRPVGLDHQHPGRHRQVGGEPSGVVDLAARDHDQPHGRRTYPVRQTRPHAGPGGRRSAPGVVGLSCALRLLEAGHRVDVLARDLPLETTSSVAAAIWYPYLAFPQDKVTAWGRTTYAEFARLADATRPTGSRCAGAPSCCASRRRTRGGSRPCRRWTGCEPRAPYADAWSFVTPVVDMPRYLAWLRRGSIEAGGTVTRLALARLPEGPLVVNCSGLGSRALAGDPTTTAGARPGGRGRAVRARASGGWPRTGRRTSSRAADDIVLGGTEDAGTGSRTPVPEVGRRHPAARHRTRPRRGEGAGAAAQGRAPPGPTRGPARARRRRHPLLRPRRRGRHPVVGLCRRGRSRWPTGSGHRGQWRAGVKPPRERARFGLAPAVPSRSARPERPHSTHMSSRSACPACCRR